MGSIIIFWSFILLTVGGYLIYARLKERSITHKPMYKKYLQSDGTFKTPYLTHEERMHRNARCPICRKTFACSSVTDQRHAECPDCGRRISETGKDFRPDFLTDERDWQYIKQHKFTLIFWVIFSDYVHGDIDADLARKLVHKIVPEDFGRIESIRYRELHDYISVSHSHLQGGPDRSCLVCNHIASLCNCKDSYDKDMRANKYPNELKENLDILRSLNPQFIINGYYRKNGSIHPRIKQRPGFAITDYFTLDDWQTIRYIINFAKKEEYSEADIRKARSQYIQLINSDLGELIKLHQALSRGEHPNFPILPSTNPDSITEVKETTNTGALYQKLAEEFF